MEATYDTRIQSKKDTRANWESNNPVLLDGEIILVVMDDGEIRQKVGNGTSKYSELPFSDEKIKTAINGKADATHKHSASDVTGLAKVATSGSYADLSNKPTSMTPTAHNQASNTINAMTGYSKPSSTGAISTTDTLNSAIGKLEKALDSKQASGSYSTTGHKHTKSEITDFPTLATVATSGSYNDLTNKPTIPAAVTVDSSLSSSSTNPVQNKVVNSALDNKVDKVSGKGLSTNDYTTAEKEKLAGIAEGANKTTVDTALSSTSTNPVQNKVINSALGGKVPTTRTVNGKALSANISLTASDVGADASGSAEAVQDNLDTHTSNKSNPHGVTAAQVGAVPTSRTVNGKALSSNISLTASDVGADASGAANTALTNAKSYTDTKISNLINSAPTTLDTLGEIATAMEENADVVEALETAIGTKANASDLTSHTGNKSNPHGVTKSQVGLGSVVNTGDSATPVSGGTTKFTTGGAYTELNKKVDKVDGKGLSTNDYTTTDKTKLNATNIAYGTCSTAAATAAKVITISGNTNWALTAGSIIIVKFTNTNTASNPTFNVNGTGAKSVWYNTALLTSSNLSCAGYANRYGVYAYDGTQFVFIGWSYDGNTTYTNASLGQGYGTCATAAATAAKVVSLSSYSLTKGGIVAVKFTYAVPASATMNINSKGAKSIFYRGAAITAGIIEAGDIATFIYDGTQYHLLTVDRHRFFSMLVPYGMAIGESADLNTTEYLKVGNYYCSSNATTKTLSNCPTSSAFMMTVMSPLSTTIDNETTKTWVYRLRKLQVYTGEEYVQYCYAGATAGTWTYGAWKKTANSDDIPTTLDDIEAGTTTKPLYVATASSSDGVAYTATVDGITALYSGLTVVITPATVSASTTPTLNLNGLGATGIRRRLSNLASTPQSGYASTWLTANKAFLLVYDGTYWIVDGFTKPAAADLYGTLSVEKGGTGATTAAAALAKLGGISSVNGLAPDSNGAVDMTNTINTLIDTRTSKVSVKAYGAKGDGTTNDTAAFQSALAANRLVYVPEGTYVLSDTLLITENSELELSQATVLKFTQTSANCIAMQRLASIKGNHATIIVPYEFTANVIHASTDVDEAGNTAVPPFTKWDPQWKMSRYVTDINICKPDSRGFHYSVNGDCNGTAVYMGCNSSDNSTFMWGVNMSGLRIAGAFNYGIRLYNTGEAWNHDMRVEAVIDACKIGVSVENCRHTRLAVTIQPRQALASDGTTTTSYAEQGIKLVDARNIDLTSSRVWDWIKQNDDTGEYITLFQPSNQYQHIAMYGDCKGLLLDDFLYYSQSTYDIRDLIYTDTPSNLEKMTILQEPIDRWFKVKDNTPYVFDGRSEKKLVTQENFDAHFDTDVVKGFVDVLPTATDENGAILNEVGYVNGSYIVGGTGATAESASYSYVGFIPINAGDTLYVHGITIPEGGDGRSLFVTYDASRSRITSLATNNSEFWNQAGYYFTHAPLDDGFKITVNKSSATAYIRFGFRTEWITDTPMIAINEEINFEASGFLAGGVKVNGDNIVMTSPSGKSFKLTVSDSGALSATAFE